MLPSVAHPMIDDFNVLPSSAPVTTIVFSTEVQHINSNKYVALNDSSYMNRHKCITT